jgi:hypothetical protein
MKKSYCELGSERVTLRREFLRFHASAPALKCAGLHLSTPLRALLATDPSECYATNFLDRDFLGVCWWEGDFPTLIRPSVVPSGTNGSRRTLCLRKAYSGVGSLGAPTFYATGSWLAPKAKIDLRRQPGALPHRSPSVAHRSFAYSVLACLRTGMSGSASFHSAKKSWYLVRALMVSPESA